VWPAYLPVPFHFAATGLLMAALGGLEQLSNALMEAGTIIYLALALCVVAGIANTVLFVRASRGNDIPAYLPLMLALLPWVMGIIGTMLGARMTMQAVEMVNPADKATIIAQGFSESLNNRLIGCWFSSAQLAAAAIGLSAIAFGRAGTKRNQAATPIAGVGLLCAIASIAASRWVGMSVVLPMIVVCVALVVAFYFAGSSAVGGSEDNVSLVASSAFAAAAAVISLSASTMAQATSKLFGVIGSVQASDRRELLERGMSEVDTAQMIHGVAWVCALGGAVALSVIATRAAAAHQPAPKAVAVPAACVVAVLALTLFTQGMLDVNQIFDAW
jgi:hypothetical protein